MSVKYDPTTKTWTKTLEALEQEESLPHDLSTYTPIYQNVLDQSTTPSTPTGGKTGSYSLPSTPTGGKTGSGNLPSTTGKNQPTTSTPPIPTTPYKEVLTGYSSSKKIIIDGEEKNAPSITPGQYNDMVNANNAVEKNNETKRANNAPKISANDKTEQIYNKIITITKNTTGADYKEKKELIKRLETNGEIDKKTREDLERNFNTFYTTEKVSPWDPNSRVRPPSPGDKKEIDLDFYKSQVPEAVKAWEEANKKGEEDLDITGRYLTEQEYYQWHYTQHGKPSGIRGYTKEDTAITNAYLEKPTDAEKQQITDIAALTEEEKQKEGSDYEKFITRILGPKEIEDTKKYGALTQNVLKDTIAELNKNKLKESQFDLYRNLEGFSEILDLNKTLANSILGDSGVGGYLAKAQNKSEEDITKDLETQLGKMTGLQSNVGYNWQKWFDEKLTEKYGIDYKQFESTENTLDVVNAALKTDATKIYDSKNKKFTDAFIQKAGFKSDAELTQFLKKQGASGTELLTSLQSGVIDTTKFEKDRELLENKIAELDTTKNRDLKLTYTGENKIPEELTVEAFFARQFIDDYLKPRFDYSKSMDEFKDYMAVSKKDKNPFQTTDRLTTIKDYGQSVAKSIQPDLVDKFDYKFDTEFYFNPEDKNAPLIKQETYTKQKEKVAADWESAKTNPDAYINPSNPSLGTWAQNAYLYGIDNPEDLKNKETFAKLHYQLIGSQANQTGLNTAFDGAIDPGTLLKLKFESPIYTKAQKIGTVFDEFITPEGFADTILKGIDPLKDNANWKKLIDQYDLKETASLDEVKKAITNSITLGSAEEIRANIKTLQELEKTPTQAELGVSYIERPEDKGPEQEKTELYNVFKSKGYQGTEKEFYTDYMPDTSREDLKLLSSVAKGKNPELDLSFMESKSLREDPMGALSKVSELATPKSTESTKRKTDSYFKIGLDDDEEEDLPSPESFLGDFTSILKK